MEGFRKREGSAKSEYWSGELAEAGRAAWDFIRDVIDKHHLKMEDGYHNEMRCISIPHTNINDDTHGHFSDDEIIQVLEKYDEVVAFAYIHRNSMNCAEVIMVDLLDGNINNIK